MEGTGHSTLRAKYLDWCSARLAERFLDLSPEEIYALARPGEGSEAADEAGDDPRTGAPAGSASESADETSTPTPPDGQPPEPGAAQSRASSLPRPTDESYRVLVQRVTEALLKRTSLPTFEQWSEAYGEEPDRFDAELLGFWKDVVGEGD